MKKLIITNNPAVKEKFKNVFFIDGSPQDILTKVRDLVHQGHGLISHPLSASLRMMFSPYRTVVLSTKKEQIDFFSAEIIEDSIIKYKNHMNYRKIDNVHSEDYQVIDILLLEAALNEDTGSW
ncbi:MAG: GrdX family protein [Desulfitobacteriaceae bacterium]|nr:GrdX family protein [Desulfitobacteriaceae bacterium]MDD4753721.1 GrdX family protein [Desulfitobacteriaceae bacterium]